MRRLWMLTLLAVLLVCAAGRAEAPEMRIEISGGEVLPGRAVIISMNAPETGVCSIRILDAEDRMVSAVAVDRTVTAGYNAMYWNGTWDGTAVPAGEWRLVMEMDGKTAEAPVKIGRMIPCLIGPVLSDRQVTIGRNVMASYCTTEAGELRISLLRGAEEIAHYSTATESGEGQTTFPASVPAFGFAWP